MDRDRLALAIGGGLSAAAALLHVGIMVVGPPAYRYFGAGEDLARLAEAGSPTPPAVTSVIAVGLVVFALYAWSGAGLVVRLPLRRTALAVIAAIYLVRGVALIPQIPVYLLAPGDVRFQDLVFSAVALVLGVVHLIGLRQRWRALGDPTAAQTAA